MFVHKKLKPIKFYVRPEVEARFRRAAMASYGYSKGALSQAGESALDHWSASASSISELAHLGDPVAEMVGLLSGEKKSSVQVQHELSALRAERVMHYAKKRK